MPHPKYGDKFTCFSCSGKFYNLNKPELICPKCGADQAKAPKKRGAKPAPKPVVPVPAEEFEAEDEGVAEDGIDEVPLQTQEDEVSFDPDANQLPVDETPDREF